MLPSRILTWKFFTCCLKLFPNSFSVLRKRIVSHLVGLGLRLHCLHRLLYLFIRSSSLFCISRGFSPATRIMKSSTKAVAYVPLLVFRPNRVGIRWVKILNRMGELTVPCMRPSITSNLRVEIESPLYVWNFRSCVMFQISWMMKAGKLSFCSL